MQHNRGLWIVGPGTIACVTLLIGLAGCGNQEDTAENSTSPSTSVVGQGTLRPGRAAVEPGRMNSGTPGITPQAVPVKIRRAAPGAMPPESGTIR